MCCLSSKRKCKVYSSSVGAELLCFVDLTSVFLVSLKMQDMACFNVNECI